MTIDRKPYPSGLSDREWKILRVLCPNCHAQTDTDCGKNKGNDGKRRNGSRAFKDVV
jgi:hypothetical protein